MANTSSAKKAARQAVKRTAINKARRTKVRNVVRKAEETIVAGSDAKLASETFVAAQSALMKAAQNGTIHKNTASRKVARLAKRAKAVASA
jgi:small subunit ribosomal protein S20